MGGSGSTRWGGHARRQTVADAPLCLSLQKLREAGPLPPRAGRGSLTWTNDDGSPHATVGFAVSAREPWGRWMTLTYRAHWGTDTPQTVEERFRLEAAPQRFGGVRWWVVCPGCRSRRGALYVPLGRALRFRCRVCYRLAYATQRWDRNDRAKRRLYLAAQRIGLHSTVPDLWEDSPPPRPKGMHHATYRRHVDAWARAHYRRELLDSVYLVRLTARAAWLFRDDPAKRAEARALAQTDFGWDVAETPDADAYVRDVLTSMGYADA